MLQQWSARPASPIATPAGPAPPASLHPGDRVGPIAGPEWFESMPHVRVSEFGRDLAAYLALGYDVRCAADGWAMLAIGIESFVLVPASLPSTRPATPPVRLQVVPPLDSEPEELAAVAAPLAPVSILVPVESAC